MCSNGYTGGKRGGEKGRDSSTERGLISKFTNNKYNYTLRTNTHKYFKIFQKK